MKTVFKLALLATGLTSTPAVAQIGADACANADAITGTGSFPFDTNVPTDTGVPATTSVEQQCVDLTADVWVEWTAPAGLDGHIVRFDLCNADFESEIAVWQGTCASMVGLGCNDFSSTCPGFRSSIEITVDGGSTYMLQIGMASFVGYIWGGGDLTITDLGPDACLSSPPDALEPNDDCGSAALVGAGLFPALEVARDNPDFLRTTIPDGQRYTAVATVSGLEFPNDFRLFLTDADCSTQLSTSPTNSGFTKTVVATNRTGAPMDVVLEARLWHSSSFPLCAQYDLAITVEPETCLELVDDGLEGNDTCDDAVPLGNGFHPGLHVAQFDADLYRIRIPGQQLMTVDALFEDELGDIDMTLYYWVWCGTSNSINVSSSYSDNERISYYNQADEPRDYILAVYMKFGGGDFGCYDLMVEGALDMPATNYCTATVNSSGEAASIEALGNPVAAEEDVFLRSHGLPQGVPGLFYFGPSQIQATFGDGFRCVGGMTQRILPATFAMGPAPSIAQRELNFAAPYASSISAGANLNFQLWYRDPMAGMSGFNLSDATNVTFQ